jgi:NADP-dependent 3-hydroxy acid dehydrogenase YdfG
MDINNAVVLVTGASSGIGAATARSASRAGAKVVLLARREDRIRQLAEELGEALPVRRDVTLDLVRTGAEQADLIPEKFGGTLKD